jgi:hypothetical protein
VRRFKGQVKLAGFQHSKDGRNRRGALIKKEGQGLRLDSREFQDPMCNPIAQPVKL